MERRTTTIFDSDMLISAVNGIAEKHRKGLFNIASGGEINYGHRPEREGGVRQSDHYRTLFTLFVYFVFEAYSPKPFNWHS